MKYFLLILSVFLLVSVVNADTSNPEGLPMTSGDTSNSSYDNFQVAGEDAAGVIGNSSYISGVGLAAMIFSPLLPNPGSFIPNVPSTVGDIICYPSPFDPDSETATIAYRYIPDVDVKIYIINISGTVVKLVSANSASRGADGYSRAYWDGSTAYGAKVGTGGYLLNIVAEGKRIAKTKLIAYR